MTTVKDHLVEYLNAMDSKRHEDAIKSLTHIIQQTTDKDEIYLYLKYRIKAAWAAGLCEDVIRDFNKIRQLGHQIENDRDLIAIEYQCNYRLDEEKTINKLRAASLKYEINELSILANQIEKNIKTMFRKKNSSGQQR